APLGARCGRYHGQNPCATCTRAIPRVARTKLVCAPRRRGVEPASVERSPPGAILPSAARSRAVPGSARPLTWPRAAPRLVTTQDLRRSLPARILRLCGRRHRVELVLPDLQ